jgi:hypothetical protein
VSRSAYNPATITGAPNASCSDGTVPNGEYIWLRITYQQNLVVPGLGPLQEHRDALVVSNSLDQGPSS